ncbi:MAG: Rid family detoxifying hydrolase [Vulcanimicrobiaceae bacterium]|jgi:2-iminobutanoate/2-iminopropanoate deaminase
MTRETVQTAAAPAAIGPYAQAVAVGPYLFCSGQIALDPATGALVEGDAAVQAAQALANLRAVLAAAGLGLADVVKTTLFLVSMDDFAAVNAAYAAAFGAGPYPARSTVAVAALPRGARVEIDAIAVRRTH